MAQLDFPRVTVTDFRAYDLAPGQVTYVAETSGEEYVVGSGAALLDGTITLAPATEAESRALIAFHMQLRGLDNEVQLPWYREWDGDGAWPYGSSLAATAIADGAEDGQSSVTLSYTLPAGKTAADVQLAAGVFLTLQDQLVRIAANPAATPTATAATVVVTPRVRAATSGITVSEAVVRARLDGRIALPMTSPGVAGPVTYAWRQKVA